MENLLIVYRPVRPRRFRRDSPRSTNLSLPGDEHVNLNELLWLYEYRDSPHDFSVDVNLDLVFTNFPNHAMRHSNLALMDFDPLLGQFSADLDGTY